MFFFQLDVCCFFFLFVYLIQNFQQGDQEIRQTFCFDYGFSGKVYDFYIEEGFFDFQFIKCFDYEELLDFVMFFFKLFDIINIVYYVIGYIKLILYF